MKLHVSLLFRRGLELLLAACLGLGTLPAHAGGLNPNDQKQIIEVVQAQLNAFAKDDAAKAFSYAAPNIRRLMGTPENFIEMVRTQYEVVYRPASTVFSQPQGKGSEAVLNVQMTEENGSTWVAIYGLQRQKNKTWRITGCVLTKPSGTTV